MLKNTTNILMLSLSLMSTATWANNTFYKWVDSNGSTHYTQTPPPKGSKSLGRVQTYNDISYSTQPQSAPAPQQATSQNQATMDNPSSANLEPQAPTVPATQNPPSKPNTQYIPLPK